MGKPFFVIFSETGISVSNERADISSPKWVVFDKLSYWEEISVSCQKIWDLDESSLAELESTYQVALNYSVEKILAQFA